MSLARELKVLHARVCESDVEGALRTATVLLKAEGLKYRDPQAFLDCAFYAYDLSLGARPAGGMDYDPCLVYLKSNPGDPYGRSEDLQVVRNAKLRYASRFTEKITELQWQTNHISTKHELIKCRLQALGELSGSVPGAAVNTLVRGLATGCKDPQFINKPGAIATDIINIISLGYRMPEVAKDLDSLAVAKELEQIAYVLKDENLERVILGFQQFNDFISMQADFDWNKEQARVWAESLAKHSVNHSPKSHFELAGRLCLITDLLERSTPQMELAQIEIAQLSKGLKELPWCEVTREFELRCLNQLAEKAVELKCYDFAVAAYNMVVRLTEEVFCQADKKSESDLHFQVKNHGGNYIRKSYLISNFMLGQIHQERGDLLQAEKCFSKLALGINPNDPEEFRLHAYLRMAICYNLQAVSVAIWQSEGQAFLPANIEKLRDSFEIVALLSSDDFRAGILRSGKMLCAQNRSKVSPGKSRNPFAQLACKALDLYTELLNEPRDYLINESTVMDIAERNVKNLRSIDFPQTLNFIPLKLSQN